MARASTLGRLCVGQETPRDGICVNNDHAHNPNPEWWITEDGKPFQVGDLLWNYYDGEYVTVLTEPSEFDGWFNCKTDKGGTVYLNSVRVCSVDHPTAGK